MVAAAASVICSQARRRDFLRTRETTHVAQHRPYPRACQIIAKSRRNRGPMMRSLPVDCDGDTHRIKWCPMWERTRSSHGAPWACSMFQRSKSVTRKAPKGVLLLLGGGSGRQNRIFLPLFRQISRKFRGKQVKLQHRACSQRWWLLAWNLSSRDTTAGGLCRLHHSMSSATSTGRQGGG